MVEFEYSVQDKAGLHARPAGVIVKAATPFKSEIFLKNMHTGNQADCKKLFALMNLGVKYETPIKITVSGNDEVIAAEKMKEIIKESL